MNLYLLKQTDRTGYDTYDSCVVAAKTEQEAREIHPNLIVDFLSEWNVYKGWAKEPDNVEVTYIGEASPHLQAGQVICSSYNAG